MYNIYKYINSKFKFEFLICKYLTATTATQQLNGGMSKK